MSVATKNPFALLDAEDASRPATPAANSAAKAPAVVPPANRSSSQKPRGGPASRGGKYYARGGAAKPASKEAGANGVDESAPAEGQRKFDGRGRGRGERGGGGGGGRGGAGAGRGGRRPFDRHSQTGKTDSDKKIQQSWGGADGNTELKTEEQADADAVVEGSNEWNEAGAGDWGTPAANTDAPADAATAEGEKPEGRPRREREPEEEDNTLTLEQYLAQQKEKDSAVPKLEGTRQANEGADVWKDAVPLAKDNEDAYFVGKSKSAPKPRAKKEERVFIEIDARFERPDRGGRGRGRGGDRGDRGRGGRGGRGGARGGRQPAHAAVDVGDEAAFPSLS